MLAKKILAAFVSLIVVLGLLVGFFGYQMFGKNLPMKDGETLGPVRAVDEGYVQVFVLDAGNGSVVLVDAGVDPEAKSIKEELARRGLGPSAVKAIFLTHGHLDHMAGVPQFPQAVVYAHTSEVDLIEGRGHLHSPVSKLMQPKLPPIRVGHALANGEVVQVGALQIQTFHIPGHTAGSAAYLAGGVLFLGDSAAAGKKGQLMPAPWLVSDDTAQNHASLRRLSHLVANKNVQEMVFGHSGALAGTKALQAFAAAP